MSGCLISNRSSFVRRAATAVPTSGRCLRWKDPHPDIPPTVEASAGEIKKYSEWRNQAAAWRFFSRLHLMEAPQERSSRPKGFVVEILTFEYGSRMRKLVHG
jgi:hypothetical protein